MKVWQWKQINKAIAEGFISRMILFVSILTETPEEEIETLPSSELIKRFKTIQHLGQVHDNNKDVIDLGIELSFIPFKQLTFGQFIDLGFTFCGHLWAWGFGRCAFHCFSIHRFCR